MYKVLSINRGQALITLLFFTVIATAVASAAVVIIMINSLSGAKFQQGTVAYEIAESGAQEAILRFLREDADYTGTTTPLTIGDGNAEITVTQSSATQYTIISKGTIGNFTKRIQVDITYADNLLTVNSQKEIF